MTRPRKQTYTLEMYLKKMNDELFLSLFLEKRRIHNYRLLTEGVEAQH